MTAEAITIQLSDALKLNAISRSNLGRLLGYFLSDAEHWGDKRQLAYALATAWHETGKVINGTMTRFAPVEEAGSVAYFNKYEPGTPIGKRLGNTQKGDGYRFRGRGDVQVTGRANYQKFEKLLGKPLVEHPDMACAWDTAYLIMREGMLKGLFTGKTLSDYINADTCDFRNARRTVNGLDKADLIAGYAMTILGVLEPQEIPPVTVTNA